MLLSNALGEALEAGVRDADVSDVRSVVELLGGHVQDGRIAEASVRDAIISAVTGLNPAERLPGGGTVRATQQWRTAARNLQRQVKGRTPTNPEARARLRNLARPGARARHFQRLRRSGANFIANALCFDDSDTQRVDLRPRRVRQVVAAHIPGRAMGAVIDAYSRPGGRELAAELFEQAAFAAYGWRSGNFDRDEAERPMVDSLTVTVAR